MKLFSVLTLQYWRNRKIKKLRRMVERLDQMIIDHPDDDDLQSTLKMASAFLERQIYSLQNEHWWL
ncbi:MAG TPA: hypothetical protein VKR32_10260 [Puia sp.]|nr:hypothetical protein [Puia sp.]